MKDFKGEKIKNLIKKIWLKSFHDFCQGSLNDTSAQIMDDLLKFESDCIFRLSTTQLDRMSSTMPRAEKEKGVNT